MIDHSSFIVNRYVQKISNAESAVAQVLLLTPIALSMHGDEAKFLLHILLLSFLVEVNAIEVEDLFGADGREICSHDFADLSQGGVHP